MLARTRKWIAVAVAASAILYVGYGVFSGWAETRDALLHFFWPIAIPVLLTTLGNYGLRYFKWVYLIKRIGISVPHVANAHVYTIGLMMTLSPAKAGEVVKPWLVRELTGVPMSRTLPVLVAERITDAIAVLSLAALGVATYASDQTHILLGALGILGVGLLVLLVESLSNAAFAVAEAIPLVKRAVPPLREAMHSLRTCLSPGPLLVCIGLSLAAWWLECVGMWLVLKGFGIAAPMDVATFVYAFATALGALSPGGVGVADASLIEGAQRLIPEVSLATATAAALLVRLATLWFGVLLGAIALMRIDGILTRYSVPVAPADSDAPPAN